MKTVKFDQPKYVGDPLNAVKIFNEKEVDELVLLDISASAEGRGPQFDVIAQIAGECFMPLGYGGGIRTVNEIRSILDIGVEKAIVNTAATANPRFVEEAAAIFGGQSIVVSIDVKKGLFGRYEVFACSGRRKTGRDPVDFAIQMEESGAGEIIVHSIDRDGTMKGYDLDLIRSISSSVTIPVIACGGAGTHEHLVDAVTGAGASAAAAGSLFVFYGKHRSVLITFPDEEQRLRLFSKREL